MDIQALLAGFLENLASITDEELFKEFEKARDDSKDSYLLDGEDKTLCQSIMGKYRVAELPRQRKVVKWDD